MSEKNISMYWIISKETDHNTLYVFYLIIVKEIILLGENERSTPSVVESPQEYQSPAVPTTQPQTMNNSNTPSSTPPASTNLVNILFVIQLVNLLTTTIFIANARKFKWYIFGETTERSQKVHIESSSKTIYTKKPSNTDII